MTAIPTTNTPRPSTSLAGSRRSIDVAIAIDRISAIRQVQIGGAVAALFIGLIAGTLAVNPVALLITFALLKQFEDGKRWARTALVIQQCAAILLGVVFVVTAQSTQTSPAAIGIVLGLAGVGIGVFTIVAATSTKTAALLPPKP